MSASLSLDRIAADRRFAVAGRGLELAPLLAVAGPLALLALALTVRPALVVQDTWLTLVAGREIVSHGLPSVDHLSLMAAGHAWVDQQWLGQLALYGAARLGGLGLAYAVCVVAVVAGFGIGIATAFRRGASPLAILLVSMAAAVAAPWGLQPRAQVLALPLFSAVLWLFVRDPRAELRSTLLVFPLLCLWANVHGSVVVGVALAVAYAVTARAPAYVLAPATVLASPYATTLPRYYRTMLVDPPFGRYVVEWRHTVPGPLTATFFALLAVAVFLVVLRRRELRAFELFALALTAAVALDAVRGLIWFSLTVVPLLPALATRKPGAQRFSGRVASVCAAAAFATIGVGVVLAAARPAAAYERQPTSLLEVVRARVAAGDTVLADDATADWLLWRLPALRGRLAYDVRFELLTPRQIRELLAWHSLAPGWRAAPMHYDLVVDDTRHVDRLIASGGWRRLAIGGAGLAAAERITSVR